MKKEKQHYFLKNILGASVIFLWLLSTIWAIVWFILVWPSGWIAQISETVYFEHGDDVVYIVFPEQLGVHAPDAVDNTEKITLYLRSSTSYAIKIPDSLFLMGVQPKDAVVDYKFFTEQHEHELVLSCSQVENLQAQYLPPNGDVNVCVVSLLVENAQKSTGVFIFPGYEIANIIVKPLDADSRDGKNVSIKIETLNHARWRTFAENYSFLAIVPLLITLISAGWKFYNESKQKQFSYAKKQLILFQNALIGGEGEEAKKIYKKLLSVQKYLENEDVQYIEMAHSLLESGCYSSPVGHPNLSEDAIFDLFSNWADISVGILEIIFKDSEKKDSEKCDNTIPFHRYLRRFPREKLSLSAFNRYQNLVGKVRLPNMQGMTDWPIKPAAPDSSEQNLVLFFSSRIENNDETKLVFSQDTHYLWMGNGGSENEKRGNWGSIYRKIFKNTERPVHVWLIYGRRGTGKTTLALSLTKYSEQSGVLGCYHPAGNSVLDIQVILANRLLAFVRERASRLLSLGYSERRLLGRIWVSVLDRHYVLAALQEKQHSRYAESDTLGKIVKEGNHSANESQNSWQIQAATELRILYSIVQDVEKDVQLSYNNWLYSFTYLAKRLGFNKINIAIEQKMFVLEKFKEIEDWIHVPLYLPVSLITLLPSSSSFALTDDRLSDEYYSLEILTWDVSTLTSMFLHRVTRGLSSGADDIDIKSIRAELEKMGLGKLIKKADNSPRNLASEWLYPNDKLQYISDMKKYLLTLRGH